MIKREYKDYEEYIKFQSKKTLDPEKRKKWLNEEWRLKIDGFKQEFNKLSGFLTSASKCLCLGARTGQEVIALNELGVDEVIGIDIVPHEPHVITGDIHNLQFEDDTFDFVYTNIIDHSINPKKMVQEIERVLKVNGMFYLQIQLGLNQDEYTEFVINNPLHDIVSLFDQSYCVAFQPVNQEKTINFAGMNFELIFIKDQKLSDLYKKYGNISTINVPDKFKELWDKINLPIQENKLSQNNIFDEEKRSNILNTLSKRAYYLTRICEAFEIKNICEVGTAEGWQFYSFCEYAKDVGGEVVSCDPRDVRSELFRENYKNSEFVNGTSLDIKNNIDKYFDFFYIDGMHDKNSVITDVVNLSTKQDSSKTPVWVFDDFDVRFGCYEDILQIISAAKGFKVWNVGLTASGNPSHQVLVNTRFQINES